MNLTELKQKPVQELVKIAEGMGADNVGRLRKQDVIFTILKSHSSSGEDISGGGVLEILQDGFGFLRSADSSYLAGPDDIYVSPSQIRKFSLRTGDTIEGKIRPPKESERYFALLKIRFSLIDKADQNLHMEHKKLPCLIWQPHFVQHHLQFLLSLQKDNTKDFLKFHPL